MRNKGAILILAIALALVCIYQLSFTWKAVSVRNQATTYATDPASGQIDDKKEQYYLDSVSTEKLFLGVFTYTDCIEQELNFGLDLKGGMNIILEISVTDVIRNLSSNPQDTTLNSALRLAKEKQTHTSRDFVTLFGESYKELYPNQRLEVLFRTKELSSQITFDASDEDVLKVLKAEADDAIDNAFNIIRTRIDQFGVAQPNIQRMETAGRILVDLPGVEDKDRVRKLLQGTANLEFFETYDNTEIQDMLMAANNVVKDYLKTQKQVSEPAKEEAAEQPVAVTENIDNSDQTSLLDELSSEGTDSTLIQETEYPLFELLMPNYSSDGRVMSGSEIGSAEFKDTAMVNFYLKLAQEKNIFPRDLRLMWHAKAIPDANHNPTNRFYLHAVKTSRDGKPVLTGDVIVNARQEFNDQSGEAYVSMSMNGEGAKDWARITKENLNRSVAIVMDNKVFSAPNVRVEIKGGSSSIEGGFTISEADDLANLLKSGKLPAPAHIIQETVVGPSLGQKAVDSGFQSFIIAFFVILVYMIFYYSRHAGLVADIALVFNMFLIVGVLASLGAALTLPGIAGIVLTIGMSVDANVLIYERIREELAAGKGLKLAVKDGYKNAYSAIIDANVTTLITGIILLLFGTGPIQGFATTLVIGIITSLFTAIFITRIVFEAYLKRDISVRFATSMTEGAFKNTNIKFLEIRKIPYIVSGLAVLISLVSIIGWRGLDLGVDFKGGRNFIIKFDQKVDNTVIAEALTNEFGQEPKVINFGSDEQVRITTRYMYDAEGVDVDEQIQQQIYSALIPIIGENISYETFSNDYWQSSQKVDPTIADDIMRESAFVFMGAILFMFIYIFVRFRNWQFGLGAILALIHDSVIVLGVFSLLHGVLKFSLEIDQAFIAALLTVVGYSVNDTVVVYDRIREYITLYPKRERKEIMNLALNSTLSRTFNTSISTLVVLLTIFILGGEAIQGFTFALMIGIIVGTYSSVFIATPLVYDTIMKAETQRVLKGKKRS